MVLLVHTYIRNPMS
ncbi:hypothetical protein F383_23494 [Gossypium arboreum]|uniref:Uncharacterized protein n=1 Tax=Gossypium arboreum TaxID=29729 RepID=A0A0B0NXX3_GOSAR|nr:hypothetical protein F383_23494 [Gossypium arboreum]